MKFATLLIMAFLTAFLLACGPQGDESGETAAQKIPGQSQVTQTLLGAYEHVRSRLANDEAVSAADFENLAEAARTASVTYEGDARAHLEQLASSAESGASQGAEGLAEAREVFAEVSKHLIALIAAEPELARGRYVFECPMAKTYPKWVQPSETVSNPYMGPEMATCGVASAWRP